MGSYANLKFKDFEVYTTKSRVDPLVMTIFREDDKKITKEPIEDDYYEDKIEYTNTVKNIKDRLDVTGFSLKKTKIEFYKQIEEEKEHLQEMIDDCPKNDSFRRSYEKQLSILSRNKFNDWQKAFKKIVKKNLNIYWSSEIEKTGDEIVDYVIEEKNYEYPFFGYPCSDPRYFFRFLLEIFKNNDVISYDVSDLINGGYYDEVDNICDSSISSLTKENIVNDKIIILTEGKTDKKILESSLKLLYPHLYDYYSFLDFDNSKKEGGAGYLVSTIKSFISSGVGYRIVAIFDNDTASEESRSCLSKIKIPSNIKILNYPNIKILENYPTLGPGGLVELNINGLAGSIEMYLGKDILKNNDYFFPIQWRGYSVLLKKYQGEIINKSEVQKKFNKKIKEAKDNKDDIIKQDWSGLKSILKVIFTAFK